MSSKFKLKNLKINKKRFFLSFYQRYLVFSFKEITIKIIAFFILLVPFVADKIMKHIIFSKKIEGDFKNIISGIFSFSYKKNSGIAGGFFGDQNFTWLIITTTFIIILITFLVFIFSKNITISLACLLLFMGGFDNLTDRFIFNYVVDYIVLLNSNFACNIGDGLIFGGIFALLAWSIGFFFVPEIKKIDAQPSKIL